MHYKQVCLVVAVCHRISSHWQVHIQQFMSHYNARKSVNCSKAMNQWQQKSNVLDWIEQCFMSPPTQYRLYGRRFLQVWCQSTEGRWLVIQTGLSLTRLISPCYKNTTCMQI